MTNLELALDTLTARLFYFSDQRCGPAPVATVKVR